MKLAFIVAAGPAEGRLRWAIPAAPLQIAGQLPELIPGVRVSLLEPEERPDWIRTARSIVIESYDAVGISVDDFSLSYGLDLVRALDSVAPELPVVLGGPAAASLGEALADASPNIAAVDASGDEQVAAAVMAAAAQRAPIPAHGKVFTNHPRGPQPRLSAPDDRADPDWRLGASPAWSSVELAPLGASPTWPLCVRASTGWRSPERVVSQISLLSERHRARSVLLCDTPLDAGDAWLERFLETLAAQPFAKPALILSIPDLPRRGRAFLRLAERAGVAVLTVSLDQLAPKDLRPHREALALAEQCGISALGLIHHHPSADSMARIESSVRAATLLPLRWTRLLETPLPRGARLDLHPNPHKKIELVREVLRVRDDEQDATAPPGVVASRLSALVSGLELAGFGRLSRYARRHGSAASGSSPKSSANTVLWIAPFFDPSGTGEDARSLALAADFGRTQIRIVESREMDADAGIDDETDRRLRALATRRVPQDAVVVLHGSALTFRRVEGASRTIGRCHCETDRPPESWVMRCEEVDELWLPSTYHVDAFARAGVPIEKLLVLPPGIDDERYRRPADPLPLMQGRRLRFGALLPWSALGGWDLLVEAFAREFHAEEPVELWIQTTARDGRLVGELRHELESFLHKKLGRSISQIAPIHLMAEVLPNDRLRRWYAGIDTLVLPSRGAGSGRTILEAMAAGVAVIAPRHGAHLDFSHDGNCWLVDAGVEPIPERALEAFPHLRGHRWAEMSLGVLRQSMRQAAEDEETRRRFAQSSREDVLRHYGREATAARLRTLLTEQARAKFTTLLVSPKTRTSRRRRTAPGSAQASVRVAWEGPFHSRTSFGIWNREICARLAAKQELELRCDPTEAEGAASREESTLGTRVFERFGAPLSGSVEIVVSHQSPPRMTPPLEGRWVWYQPVESAGIPVDWARACRRVVDEVWCTSRFDAECYLSAGVPADRIALIPRGVDVDRFRPHLPPAPIETRKHTRLLFVGDASMEGGLDLLLNAYTETFTASDDVTLIVLASAPTENALREVELMVQAARSRADAPELLLLREQEHGVQRAAIYAACDALICPSRTGRAPEALLEAMAAGTPGVVTAAGEIAEICDASTSFLILAHREICEDGTGRRVGKGWIFEPDHDSLSQKLRRVVAEPQERAERAAAGRERALRNHSWEKIAAAVAERLVRLATIPVRRTERPQSQQQGALVVVLGSQRVRSERAARIINLMPGDESAMSIVQMLVGAPEPSVVLMSDGACDAEELLEVWTTRFEVEHPEVLLMRSQDGALLIAPREALLSIDLEQGLVSSAALLDWAHQLEQRGKRVAAHFAGGLFEPRSDATFRAEATAVDRLIHAHAEAQAQRYESAIASAADALVVCPGYAAAAHLLERCVEAHLRSTRTPPPRAPRGPSGPERRSSR